MKLRKFSSKGVALLEEYLSSLETDPDNPIPYELLENPKYTELFGVPTDIARKHFGTKLAASEYLDRVLTMTKVSEVSRDVGLWSWLTLLYFDELCPADTKGQRVPKERARYVPQPSNYQRYYRHLLLGPYLTYRANRDKPTRAMAFLCRELHILDDIVGQLSARSERVKNPGIVELATRLYFDPAKSTTRKGAGGKGPGSPRRLADVLDQFDLTWDLYAMSADEFLKVLPSEFDRFRNTA